MAANQSYYFNDLITGVAYDNYGRQDKAYIPSTVNGHGGMVPDIEANIVAFYSGTEGNEIDGLIPHSGTEFSFTKYEDSPLNRVEYVTDPMGGTTSYLYGTNEANEVICWSVDVSGNCTGNTTYNAGELYATQTTDPEGNTVKEYKDKLGQVVLKVAADTAKTYYVYDDFGLLRYVLSPEASAMGTGTYAPDNAVVKGLCYYYEYDARKRMVKKQLPGADEVLMVYDIRDRLVLTQDGKTRKEDELNQVKRWLYTKYDDLNRPTETGWLTTADTHSALQTAFYSTTNFPASCSFGDVLTQTSYDSYIGSPVNITPNSDVKGMVTRTVAKKLDNSGNVTTDYFYDDKYRVIQTVVSGSPITQTTTNSYDFVGNLLTSTEAYSGELSQTITKHYTYDHAGRLEKVKQKIDGDTKNDTVVLAAMDYNELGQLMLKKLHMANDTSYVQDIDYLYDVRGWLTNINNFTDTTYRKLYAQDLSYYSNGNINTMEWKNTMLDEDCFVEPGILRTYSFGYDGLNRLETANYNHIEDVTGITNSGMFDVSIPQYDLNGNIRNLNRNGNIAASGSYEQGVIDTLAYTYEPNSNRLSSVGDNTTATVNHDLHYSNGTGSYAYDTNGNATFVPHTGGTITYNYLNLPTEISIAGQGDISYLYDAFGNKLKKSYNGVYSYYQGSVLKIDGKEIIQTGEGRVVNESGWNYEYDLKDHLGNTRISFGIDTIRAVPIQYKDYYPFGLEMANWYKTSDNKFLYDGKELQDEGGLDWYDYGARFYDPVLGRWHVIDNKAEKYTSSTPYAYALNNPILFLDPDGNEVWKSIKNNADGTRTVTLNFDIRVKNSGGYSSDQIKGWSGKIASQIKSSFSGRSSDSKTTYVAKVNMDLSGKDNGNNYTMDFVPNVKDENGSSTVNYGRMDGEFGDTKSNNMQIKAPGEDNGAYEEQTDEGVGRTGAHEVGHTGNLYHPTDEKNNLEGTNVDGNLMHQSWNPKAGSDLKPNQKDEFSKHVQEKKPDYLK